MTPNVATNGVEQKESRCSIITFAKSVRSKNAITTLGSSYTNVVLGLLYEHDRGRVRRTGFFCCRIIMTALSIIRNNTKNICILKQSGKIFTRLVSVSTKTDFSERAINRFIFIMNIKCVIFEVDRKFVNITLINFRFGILLQQF